MDQSTPSWLEEGDPTRSLVSGELPAASGELPTAQPGESLAGWSRGAPAGVGCQSTSDLFGAVGPGSPASEAAARAFGLGRLLPAPRRGDFGEGVSEGCDNGCARGERAVSVRGKFSSSVWSSHVYACEGLDPAGCAGTPEAGALGGPSFPWRFRGGARLQFPGQGRIRPRRAQPFPRPRLPKCFFTP